MKAVIHTRYGDSTVLEYVDVEVPAPGAGEVRVKIVVSGVNPTDWKGRAGGPSSTSTPGEARVPNQDGSGIVDSIGPGVEGLTVGDRVWVHLAAHERPTGTAQEYTVLPQERVVHLPDTASFDVGAALGVPAMTAHRALTVSDSGPARLGPGTLQGRTILVTGGAGAVGHAAIQLARWSGAEVITTVSSRRKAALASAAGADHVINYREGAAAAEIRKIAANGVDQIVEVAPSANAALDSQVLANHGTVAVYATEGQPLNLDVWPHLATNTRYQFVLLYTVGNTALRAAADDIVNALKDRALPVGEEAGLPLTRFELDRTSDAHDAVQANAIGKVLIDVSSHPFGADTTAGAE